MLQGLAEEASRQHEAEIDELRKRVRRIGFRTHVTVGVMIHDLRALQLEVAEQVTSITGESMSDPGYMQYATDEISRSGLSRPITQADIDARRSFRRPFSGADSTRHMTRLRKPSNPTPPPPSHPPPPPPYKRPAPLRPEFLNSKQPKTNPSASSRAPGSTMSSYETVVALNQIKGD